MAPDRYGLADVVAVRRVGVAQGVLHRVKEAAGVGPSAADREGLVAGLGQDRASTATFGKLAAMNSEHW